MVINVMSSTIILNPIMFIQNKQVHTFTCVGYDYKMECVNKDGEYSGNHCNEHQQSY